MKECIKEYSSKEDQTKGGWTFSEDLVSVGLRRIPENRREHERIGDIQAIWGL